MVVILEVFIFGCHEEEGFCEAKKILPPAVRTPVYVEIQQAMGHGSTHVMIGYLLK